MTLTRRRAIFGLIIVGCVAIAFLFIFFTGGGAELYHEDRPRKLITAGVFLMGFLSYFGMYYYTRRSSGGPILQDERDDRIARKASGTTLIVILLYVYLSNLVLWETFGGAGLVPVGWMFFQAYFTILVGIASQSISTLVLDSTSSVHVES